jgi:hypothetical protein
MPGVAYGGAGRQRFHFPLPVQGLTQWAPPTAAHGEPQQGRSFLFSSSFQCNR